MYSAGWNISYNLPNTEYVFFLCMYKEKQLNYLKIFWGLEHFTVLFHNLYLGCFGVFFNNGNVMTLD